MAAHAYTQLRKAVISALSSLKPKTGAGMIHSGKMYPKTNLPAATVYTSSERHNVENPAYINTDEGKRYRRFLNIVIEIAVKGADEEGVEDELDALQLLAEQGIYANDTMGGGVIATDLITVNRSYSAAEEKLVVATMTYRIEFRTTAADPTTFLK